MLVINKTNIENNKHYHKRWMELNIHKSKTKRNSIEKRRRLPFLFESKNELATYIKSKLMHQGCIQ